MQQLSFVLLEKLEEVARDRYNFEHERADSINSRIAITLNVAFFVFAGIAYFCQLLPDFRHPQFSSICFALIFLASTFFFLRAVTYIFKLFSGFKNGYIPLPEKSKQYVDDLLAYYEHEAFSNVATNEKEQLVSIDISKYLMGKYEEAAANNFQVNNSKSLYVLRSNRALMAAIVGLFLTGAIYSINHVNSDNVVRVSITNKSMEVQMSAEDKEKLPQPPAKPKPPATEYIKENANVASRKISLKEDKKK